MIPLLSSLMLLGLGISLGRVWQKDKERKSLSFLLAFLLILAGVSYAFVGRPMLPSSFHQVQLDDELQNLMGEEDFLTRLAHLEARLKEDPHDSQGWQMLGRSYTFSGQYNKARLAYERALMIYPANKNLLALYTDLLINLQDPHADEIFAKLVDATTEEQELIALAIRALDIGAIRQAILATRRLYELYPDGGQAQNFLKSLLDELENSSK